MTLVSMLGIVAAFLGVIGVCFAVSSAIQSVSSRKGKQRFTAFLCIAGCVYGIAFSVLAYQAKLPTLELFGEIERVHIYTEGKGHRTLVVVRSSDGEFTLDASGTSAFFHTGQSIRARYQGLTGRILKAHFLSPDGAEIGVFNGTDTWFPYWLLLVGSLVAIAGYKKYRRDSEAADRA